MTLSIAVLLSVYVTMPIFWHYGFSIYLWVLVVLTVDIQAHAPVIHILGHVAWSLSLEWWSLDFFALLAVLSNICFVFVINFWDQVSLCSLPFFSSVFFPIYFYFTSKVVVLSTFSLWTLVCFYTSFFFFLLHFFLNVLLFFIFIDLIEHILSLDFLIHL